MYTEPVELPKMEHLRSFLAVADYGTIGEAAPKLGLSPSAVSRHLTALEAWFGKEMVISANVKLDEDVEKFLGVIRMVFKDLDDCRYRTPQDQLIRNMDKFIIDDKVIKKHGVAGVIKALSLIAGLDEG